MIARAGAVVTVVLALVASCGGTPTELGRANTETLDRAAAPSPPAPDLSGDGPGSLLASAPITEATDLVALGARVERVVYRSTDRTGSETRVSGVVAIPSGAPPDGGWPVVGYGHGATGLDTACAPSLSPTLRNIQGEVARLVGQGYAVAMTDYQGLGVRDVVHPFLDAETLGRNVVDAVRAARRLDDRVSDRWVGVGVSLGGMAVWAAHDLAGAYGDGLDLLGTLALAPLPDTTSLADAIEDGDLTRPRFTMAAWAQESLGRLDESFDPERLHGAAAEAVWSDLVTCDSDEIDDLDAALAGLEPSDLASDDDAAVDAFRTWLESSRLPLAGSSVPLLVAYGEDDQLAPVADTRAAIARACRRGTPVEAVERAGEGHNDLAYGGVTTWLAARFAGADAVSTCSSGSLS